MFEFKPPAAWEVKFLTAAQLLKPILDTSSLEGAAQRLALRGEEIMRNARDTAARSELEISGAFRRR